MNLTVGKLCTLMYLSVRCHAIWWDGVWWWVWTRDSYLQQSRTYWTLPGNILLCLEFPYMFVLSLVFTHCLMWYMWEMTFPQFFISYFCLLLYFCSKRWRKDLLCNHWMPSFNTSWLNISKRKRYVMGNIF